MWKVNNEIERCSCDCIKNECVGVVCDISTLNQDNLIFRSNLIHDMFYLFIALFREYSKYENPICTDTFLNIWNLGNIPFLSFSDVLPRGIPSSQVGCLVACGEPWRSSTHHQHLSAPFHISSPHPFCRPPIPNSTRHIERCEDEFKRR